MCRHLFLENRSFRFWCKKSEISSIQDIWGIPEGLKHFCSIRVTILMNRKRLTRHQTKANGRKFWILMPGTLSVISPALGATKKEARKIKLSINLSSVAASILPITSVIFPSRSTSVWIYSQIHFSESKRKKAKEISESERNASLNRLIFATANITRLSDAFLTILDLTILVD